MMQTVTTRPWRVIPRAHPLNRLASSDPANGAA